MSDAGRGLPLLSGPPPPVEGEEQSACRKCNKEFNMIFARARRCNHCGYSYCHSCSDYQAMMPRTGTEQGYDLMNVCSFCIEFLQITAAGKQQLKAMPLQKLKKYLTAYNLKADRIVEKDDLIDAIVSARGPNGCLPPSNENYYRKFSVPNRATGRSRGLFSRQPSQSASTQQPPPRPPTESRPEFARPDLTPDNPPPPPPRPSQYTMPQAHPAPPPQPQQQQYDAHPQPRQFTPHDNMPHYHSFSHVPPTPPSSRPVDPSRAYGYPGYNAHTYQAPPGPPPSQYYPRPQPQAPPHNYYHAPPPPPHASRPQTYQPPPPRPSTTRPTNQATQSSQPPPRPRTVSTPPPPSLDQLLNMTHQAISTLPISALKAVLFNNHVNAGQILEKSELVKRVLTLIADEKADRERQRQIEEREEMERVQRQMELHEAAERERAEREPAANPTTSASEETHEEAHADGAHENNDNEGKSNPHSEPAPPSSPPKSTPVAPKTTGSASTLERTGLCVICQDEEANIAIVDCGHMAMCRGCSDLVMASSRECPLCRTRIVTEARLLRIFKT